MQQELHKLREKAFDFFLPPFPHGTFFPHLFLCTHQPHFHYIPLLFHPCWQTKSFSESLFDVFDNPENHESFPFDLLPRELKLVYGYFRGNMLFLAFLEWPLATCLLQQQYVSLRTWQSPIPTYLTEGVFRAGWEQGTHFPYFPYPNDTKQVNALDRNTNSLD